MVERINDPARRTAMREVEHQVADQVAKRSSAFAWVQPLPAASVAFSWTFLTTRSSMCCWSTPRKRSLDLLCSNLPCLRHEYRAKTVESRVSRMGKRIVPMPNRCCFELVPFKGLRDEPGERRRRR